MFCDLRDDIFELAGYYAAFRVDNFIEDEGGDCMEIGVGLAESAPRKNTKLAAFDVTNAVGESIFLVEVKQYDHIGCH